MKGLAGLLLTVLVLGVSVGCSDTVAGLSDRSPSLADQPGPGDKQCVPGQNAPPQGGKKAGVCSK
jgi:hypothetical protein